MAKIRAESHQILAEIQSAKGGDDLAKDRLTALLLPIIRDATRGFYRNWDDKESATGVIILKLLEKIDIIDVNRCPLPFIKTIARNFCVDEMRKESHRRHQNAGQINLKAPTVINIDGTIDEIFGEYADIIKLWYVEGKGIKEITKTLDLPMKTVKYRLQTAYFKFREYLYD